MEGGDRTDPAELLKAAFLRDTSDIYNVEIASKKRLFGRLVVRLRDVVRRLLAPTLSRQNIYNEVNAELTVQMLRHVAELRAAHERVESLIGAATQQIKEDLLTALEVAVRTTHAAGAEGDERLAANLDHQLTTYAAGLQADIAEVERRLTEQLLALSNDTSAGTRSAVDRIGRAERVLRRVQHHVAGDSVMAPADSEAETALEPLDIEFDYLGFEERFRGSEDDIRARQQSYVDLFRDVDEVVDIACGRGEFLELLDEIGVHAIGIDVDLDAVLLCKEKGLEVLQEDAFAYLDRVPDASVGGIFSAQFIEHVPGPDVLKLIRLAYSKLRPGGILVVETVNPACLATFALSFYVDPTHVRPVHPEALRFVAESSGFEDVELRFSMPVDPSLRLPPVPGTGAEVDAFNAGVERLNDLLFGFQDYAVVARRPRRG